MRNHPCFSTANDSHATGARDWRTEGEDMMMSQRFSAGTNHIQRRAVATIAEQIIHPLAGPQTRSSLILIRETEREAL